MVQRYYFHIVDNGKWVPDEEGGLFATLEEVKHEAVHSAQELASQALSRGESPERICVEVHDSRQAIILAVDAKDAFVGSASFSLKPICRARPQGKVH